MPLVDFLAEWRHGCGMSERLSGSMQERSPCACFRALSVGAQAAGAFAIGALAVGAVAVGAVVIGKLVIGSARIKRLEIDELVVGDLRVTGSLKTPGDEGR